MPPAPNSQCWRIFLPSAPLPPLGIQCWGTLRSKIARRRVLAARIAPCKRRRARAVARSTSKFLLNIELQGGEGGKKARTSLTKTANMDYIKVIGASKRYISSQHWICKVGKGGEKRENRWQKFQTWIKLMWLVHQNAIFRFQHWIAARRMDVEVPKMRPRVFRRMRSTMVAGKRTDPAEPWPSACVGH